MKISTLGEILPYQSAQRPDEIAMIYAADERQWTFKALDAEASQCANAMQSLGIGSQDRVAFLDKNIPEYFTFLFGASKLDAVTVAVNWRLAAPEMEYIINHSQAKLLLVGEDYLPRLADMQLELSEVVVVGDPGESGYPSYAEWIGNQAQSITLTPADTDNTCFQLYTSGTTGLPKGVETTHGNMLGLMSGSTEALNYTAESTSLVCMPLFHIAGAGWAVAGFYEGAKTILLREPNMQEILRVIPAYRTTHSVFVPAVLQFMLNEPNVKEVDFSSMEAIVYGASPISEQVLRDAIDTFHAGFFGVYGLTETTGTVTRLDQEDHDPGGPRASLLRSCGRPSNGHEIKVMNNESGEEASEGEVGEIWIRGPQVMRGYWRNPDATAEVINEEGWFKSGDAGYLRNGYLFIHDRVKDMIISGAENIYPAEIENVLMKHPGVADVAVIGIPDDTWGETVKAIICREDDSIEADQLIEYCRERLAHYKCPASVDWIDELPRNPSGKILKTELREPYWKDRDRRV